MEKADSISGNRALFHRILREGPAAICTFELVRNFTVQRLIVAGILAVFPPAMMFLILIVPRLMGATMSVNAPELLILVLVSISCFLSLLLWSSTIVDADLEGRTWVYIASRPWGRVSSLFGKYLASLFQCWAVSLLAICGSVLVAYVAGDLGRDSVRLCLLLMAVFGVAAIVYNSVLSLFGVYFFRRAMLACVAWALVSELFLASVPAIVRFISVRYHIQELVFHWIGWLIPDPEFGEIYRGVYGDFGIWFHLGILAAISVVTMSAALWWINHHEYLSAEES